MTIKHLETHLRQYEIATEHLAERVSMERYEDMVAGLLSRDALEGAPRLSPQIKALDEAFSVALRKASAEWWRRVTKISIRGGFAQAAWWLRILGAAVEEPAPLRKAG